MNEGQLIASIESVLNNELDCLHMHRFSSKARLNEDLYLDSVLVMQLLIHLELHYGIDIPDSAMSQEDISTVENLASFLLQHLSSINHEHNDAVDETPFEDIKVHCFVSCLCEAIKASPIVDHRPFYFGVWDADVVVTPESQLAYHDENISHQFFIDWYKKIYGVNITPWYRSQASKEENIATLEQLLSSATASDNIMVMLDMYLLPERENKFNQNPFPHYVLLEKTSNEATWFMRDPDFRWEGEVRRQDVVKAISSEHVEGGYTFNSDDIVPSSNHVIAHYFMDAFKPNDNVLTSAIRDIVEHHSNNDKEIEGRLGEALKQIPVLAIRKYAYEHGFAFFWRDIGFPEVTFEFWCEEIEKLVSTYKNIQYKALKLSELAKENLDTSLLKREIFALLDLQDCTEKQIKEKLYAVFNEWLAFHKIPAGVTQLTSLENMEEELSV